MTLAPRTRFGPHEIVAELGVGGMGEVYRATDTRLKRQVAIKVLPAAMAEDANRLARFQREAEVLAALNHPNIAHVYGVEAAEGRQALVMELVEGATLADRIAQGPMPIDEALPIANQVALALEAAHEQGIVHRDLKPANIKVRPDGTAKVLDFGLAKAVEAGLSGGVSPDRSAPTLTSPAMTGIGMILGTAAYMSPEQARGRPVDKRTDIWAFGCVLFEMLTGRRAFPGDDVTETIASVMKTEPDWTRLRADVPARVERALRISLDKDPRRRGGDIAAIRLALEGAFESTSDGVAGHEPTRVARRQPSGRWLVAAATVALIVGVAAWLTGRASVPAEPRPVIKAVYQLPENRRLSVFVVQPLAIAPDGQSIVYVTSGSLYQRARDQIDDRQILSQSLFAYMPFFSPDGQSLGYLDSPAAELKRVDLAGGQTRTIVNFGGGLPAGARWEADDTVLYAIADGIWQVSASGGRAERLVTTKAGEAAYGPERLPGGKGILFTLSRDTAQTWDAADIVVAVPGSTEPRTVHSGGREAHYLPTGHLIYVRGDVLYAVPFDLDRLTTSGAPVPVLDGIRSYDPALSAVAFYAVSDDGTLVYQPGRGPAQSTLAWTKPDGSQEALDLPPGSYSSPRLSPDGRLVAFALQDGTRTDVYVYAVAGGSQMRRLTEQGNNAYPIWSRDGSHVVFQSDRDGERAIFWRRADGTAPAERLTTPEAGSEHIPETWSPAEDRMAFSVVRGPTSELWTWTSAERAARRFGTVGTMGYFNSAFSPDGRWLAYTHRQPGAVSVWLASVASPATRYQLGQDTEVAHHPLWSRDGRRLFYFSATTPMVVDVTTRPTVALGRPTRLLNLPINVSPRTELNHDIAPDNARFVTIVPGGLGDRAPADQIVTVYNWFEELKRLAPVK